MKHPPDFVTRIDAADPHTPPHLPLPSRPPPSAPPLPPPIPPRDNSPRDRPLNLPDGRRLILPTLHTNLNEACLAVSEVVEVLREKVYGENMTDENHISGMDTSSSATPTMSAASASATSGTSATASATEASAGSASRSSESIDLLLFPQQEMQQEMQQQTASDSTLCSIIPNVPSLLDDPIPSSLEHSLAPSLEPSLAPPIPPKAAPSPPLPPPPSPNITSTKPKTLPPTPSPPPLSSTPSPGSSPPPLSSTPSPPPPTCLSTTSHPPPPPPPSSPPSSPPPLPPKLTPSFPPLPPKGSAPLPPPPPPPKSSLTVSNEKPENRKLDKPETCQNVQIRREAENLSDRPEWQKGHFLFHFRKTESILQVGPKCGLVAFRMLCGISPLPTPASAAAANSAATTAVDAAADSAESSSPQSSPHPLPPFPTVEELLHHAQTAGFSSQGEMFSCEKMKQLVDCFLPRVESRVVRLPDKKMILKHLLTGGTAMVPYDKDSRNFGPTKKSGHKAHWALLLGCMVSLPEDLINRLVNSKSASLDLQFEANKTSLLQSIDAAGPIFLDESSCFSSTTSSAPQSAIADTAVGTIRRLRQPSLYRTTRQDALISDSIVDSDKTASSSCSSSSTSSSFVDEVMDRMLAHRVVALQGKSRNLMFWDVDELLESNRQLTSYDITAVEGELVFPDGNVTRGLCDQIVLVDSF